MEEKETCNLSSAASLVKIELLQSERIRVFNYHCGVQTDYVLSYGDLIYVLLVYYSVGWFELYIYSYT